MGLGATERVEPVGFVWLISHQLSVFFSQNKPATSNQPAVLFSQNKSASATSQTNKLSVILIHRATFCTLAADNCIAVMQLGLLGYTFALL
jgi:hypothetical protein